MFKALVELGKKLEREGRLPPPGFYSYKDPIRWRVTVFDNEFFIAPIDRQAARPFSGRTSGIQPHLLADEASYALGVSKDAKGKKDKRAKDKLSSFISLLEKFLQSPQIRDRDLDNAVTNMVKGLKAGWQTSSDNFAKITSKDWVEFVPAEGRLVEQPLFEHPEAVEFWLAHLEEISAPDGGIVFGECAVCGEKRKLISRIPLGVKLVGNSPLHSFNQASFPSFVSGASPEKTAHIGLCFRCADTASRAFNYLSQSDLHRKRIISDNKRDALSNQIALYWVKAPAPLEAGERVLDATNLSEMLAQILHDDGPKASSAETAPRATLAQMESLLKLPWRPREAALRLDDYGFYLAVLSPNVGRIALREWIDASLEGLKKSMSRFLGAMRIVSPRGDIPKPHSISQLLQALESHNPNHLRGLLRTAYAGHPPPPGLKQAAIPVLRNAHVLNDPKQAWRHQGLVALIKLVMFYGNEEEARNMEKLNAQRKHPAYLSGRLLAVLEEAQKRSQGYNINRTLVEKFYGAASTAPAATFGMLMRTAAVSHLQKAGSLNPLVEEIISALDDSGGFPKTLTLEEQAEFALGFYHQRADFRAKNKEKSEEKAEVSHE